MINELTIRKHLSARSLIEEAIKRKQHARVPIELLLEVEPKVSGPELELLIKHLCAEL